ncbi:MULTISPECIES: DUF6216 family protein [Cupriavidus]
MDTFAGIKAWASLSATLGITSAALGLIAVAWLIWRRTKSTHSLMTRIWLWFDRNSKNNDRTISDFLDDQTALMQFRFTTGVPARTLPQAHRLIGWIKSNEENIDAIKACGDYFDIELPGLRGEERLPSKIQQVMLAGAFVILFVFASLAILGAAQSSAFLRTKATGISFLLFSDRVVMFWSDETFSAKQCNGGHSEIRKRTGFNEDEANAVCKLFADGSAKTYVSENVRSQRVIFPFLSLILAFPSALSFGQFMCGARARAMSKRLERKRRPVLDLADDDGDVVME